MKIEAKKLEHFNAARTQIHRAASLTEKMFESGSDFRREDVVQLNRLVLDASAAAHALDCLAAGNPPPKIGDQP